LKFTGDVQGTTTFSGNEGTVDISLTAKKATNESFGVVKLLEDLNVVPGPGDTYVYSSKFLHDNLKSLKSIEISNDYVPPTIPENATEEEKEAISTDKESRYKRYYEHQAQELAGLTPFLKDLKDHGVKIAIGTSAPLENLDFFTEVLHIRKYFDVEIYDKSVVNGKPNPEVFLSAAVQLGVDIDHCLVFEDAKIGIQAAHNAKMRVACVTTSHNEDELTQAGAIWSKPDYVGMNYEKFLELFSIEPTYPQFIQPQYV
jgi:HAD superfamily hydrolase (TIGR01509 family)